MLCSSQLSGVRNLIDIEQDLAAQQHPAVDNKCCISAHRQFPHSALPCSFPSANGFPASAAYKLKTERIARHNGQVVLHGNEVAHLIFWQRFPSQHLQQLDPPSWVGDSHTVTRQPSPAHQPSPVLRIANVGPMLPAEVDAGAAQYMKVSLVCYLTSGAGSS